MEKKRKIEKDIQEIQRQTRSCYWDNLKGILIVLVVFAHLLFDHQQNAPVIDGIVDYIYMFHMPAFVFVSGYFGKSERSHSYESIMKLLFLYFVFNSLMGFLFEFDSLLIPRYSFWYLLALAVWRLTAHHLAKFKDITFTLLIIAVIAGFYADIDNTFAVARIIGFYPYYMAGYLLEKEKNELFLQQSTLRRLGNGIPVGVATAVLAYASYHFFYYSDDSLQMIGYEDPMDSMGRIALFLIAFGMIRFLRCICPEKKIPLLTKFGRNSMWIFVFHRPVTLWLNDWFAGKKACSLIFYAVLLSILLCVLLGNDIIAKYMDRFLEDGIQVFAKAGEEQENKKINIAKIVAFCIALWFVVMALIQAYVDAGMDAEENETIVQTTAEEDTIWPVMSSEQKQQYEKAFRITFAGDLILLEDQVKRGYKEQGYDFSEVFSYAKNYISSADYAIGVFEGPMAGEQAGYTTSNYDDGKELYLNFPDEFAQAVKEAGFDLVTTANNHVLDKGVQGAIRTLDILDRIGLDHTGSYRDAEEKKREHIKLVECEGIRIAVLSYTYGSNYVDDRKLTKGGNLAWLTSVAFDTQGDIFDQMKADVEQDFIEAKALNPDLIVVLPHLGTQFQNMPDEEQLVWFEIFKENGADIILGDHPHVVEPVQIEKTKEKTVFTAYCPGNFANIYRENQGDTSMLVDVYIDRESKTVIGGSVVPLYTQAMSDGNYRAIPIYEIMNDNELRKCLSTDDLERAKKAHGIITEVLFGKKMDISGVTERYFMDHNGFMRSRTPGLGLTEQQKKSTLYKALQKADTVCFIGDSVTEGTKNGGCPWYEPLTENLPDKQIYNVSKGGCTVSYMTERVDKIPKADLYVVALGTNDVRYREEDTCAMTEQDYVKELGRLKKALQGMNKDVAIIFIAPWYSTDADPYCPLSYAEKTSLNEKYTEALETYCKQEKCGFINANPYIRKRLEQRPDREYLLDHIHPNASKGVIMYTEAVLSQ